MNGLISVYKKQGETPYDVIKQLKKLYINEDVKVGYAGRLDPLASGVLLLMIGDTCKNRDLYQNSSKVYRFKILLGVSTDTLDPMGLVTSTKPVHELDEEMITGLLPRFTGQITQRYPLYSSYALDGVPMYQLAREGNISDNDRPAKTVSVNKLEIIKIEEVELGTVIEKYSRIIKNVHGDFRQDEIIMKWEEVLLKQSKKHYSIELLLDVGSGTYMRSLAEDIAQELGTVGIAYDIERQSVGNYTLDKALKLDI